MDSSNETPIACTSCAKAKAKCDKKVPCTRCATKRIHCQPRNARRSGDNTNRQPDVSWSFPAPQLGAPVENPMQWGAAPFTPASLAHTPLPSPYGVTPTYASHQPQRIHQRKRKSDQLFDFQPSNGLMQTPPATSHSLESTMQSFGDMEGMLRESEYSPSDEGPNEASQLMMSAEMQLPDDFGTLEHSLQYPNQFAGRGVGSSTPAHLLGMESVSERSSPRPKPPAPTHESPSETWLYHTSVLEHPAVVAARESWSYFKCNPSTSRSACPRTARIHLEGLEQTLKSREAWQQHELLPEIVKPASNQYSIKVEPFNSFTRDKLLAITQIFIHRASQINYANSSGRATPTDTESSGFIILPPSNVLEHFLDAYVCHLEPHYPSVPAGLLNTNDFMRVGNAQAASLLLLLMIALGASATPNVEARFLTSGLIEVCRVSLSDMIEKNIEAFDDLNVFRCGLLFTIAAVWSGDKWHMDIGMAQRGVYIAMLEHGGLLDSRDTRLSMAECHSDPDMAWNKWKPHEARSRLVASWVLLDQELSLFMDVAPILSMSSLMTVMPDMDVLWRAKSSGEWLKAYERANGAACKPRMTLCDLFRFFLDGGLGNPNVQLSPIQLRLLLHPLQSLTIHLRQFLRCYPEESSSRKGAYAINKSALSSRFEEIQSLLKQWYALVRRCPSDRAEDCAATSANLIIYHLISLNALICLPDIENYARNESGPSSPQSAFSLRGSYTEHTEEIFFHCGQILRLVRLTAESVRPPWWPAAIYRAALVSWATSMANARARNLLSSLSREENQPFALDTLTPKHPSILRYLSSGEGQPMFTKSDGTMVPLEEPQNILTHCAEFLGEEQTTSFKEGIQSKLAQLAERWQSWRCE